MKTKGLYHIQINVSNMERSLAFYTGFLGMREASRAGGLVFLSSPRGRDLLTLNPTGRRVNIRAGGLQHFGFAVTEAELEKGLKEAKAHGVEVLSTGEHEDGERYAYLRDPDGYVIEMDVVTA